MATLVRDLMSTPAVTCDADASLAAAAGSMQAATIGSIVVVDGPKVAGILTERDLLRAASGGVDPNDDAVRHWMTPGPDVLGPNEEAGAAWESLTSHHYRHLPVVDGDELVGVVSWRDLLGVARIRPASEHRSDVPKGLDGVVVAETTVGDVRGTEGFFHYGPYSAVDLAATRSLEDVWYLLLEGALPDRRASAAFADEIAGLREMPASLAGLLPAFAEHGVSLEVLRTAISLLGADLGWRPTHDIGRQELRDQTIVLCALMPTILCAAHRLRSGLPVVAPRRDLGCAANYLWMLTGKEPEPEHVRALEQYLILTVDHGFNASTFTARVITSTGADLAAAVCGAIGAFSGPLHGGAPSRALDTLDAIGTPANAEPWLRRTITRGERIMGFGHRVYKTEDPRSAFLRDVALRLGDPLATFAQEVERTTVALLAELKPGRQLYANVEFYAGVVMLTCGIPREMFTPTFCTSRVIGWSAHILEQAADNRLIRPAARYVGPPPPRSVPLP